MITSSQVVPLLEPSALGPDLHQRHVGRVVDEQRRVRDLAHPLGQPAPVVVAHCPVRMRCIGTLASAGSERIVISLRPISRREEHRRQRVPDRRRSREVQGKRAFPDGGPGRDDDHLARVQAVGQGVEVGEAGRDAADAAAVGADRLDLLQGAGMISDSGW